MNRTARPSDPRVLALLALLELLSVFYLWTLDATSLQGQRAFALILSLMLVSFSMISYVYRTERGGRGVSRGLLVAGCLLALAILFTNLTL